MSEREILQRLSHLEGEVKEAEQKIGKLEEKLSYYDRMALKWGGFCMGMLTFGALISGHFDKLKEKVLLWLSL